MQSHSDRKEEIISAATILFSRFGLEKTTMEDIAKASQKGKSSLYYYFKSKEEVFAEVIKKEIVGLQGAIDKAIENEDDPDKKLKKFVYTRLNYLSEKANQYTTVKDEYLKHHVFIEHLTADYSKWEIDTLKSIIEYGRTRGLFEVSDLDSVSLALFLALKGFEYPWAINLAKKDIQKGVETLVNVLLSGLRKR